LTKFLRYRWTVFGQTLAWVSVKSSYQASG
jgi:hypothetical protein